MKPEISEEIISGWRRDFIAIRDEFPTGMISEQHWAFFLTAKTSSHERILDLEREIDRIRKRGINEAMGDMKTYYEEKLTKRDELLKRSLLWNEAMLKIAIVSIDEEKQRAETTSQLYQLIADIKQLEQEK